MKMNARADDVHNAYIAAVIAGLRDGGHNVFRSRSSQDVAGCEQWLQAVKNPISERWTVMRHQRLPDGLEHQETASSSPVCFFDALRTCASFEVQRGLGGAPLPAGDVAHYGVAADAANVPLDEDGMPHPAANGVILTEGFFSERARAVAARTKDQPIGPPALRANGVALASLFSRNGGDAANDDFIGQSIARHKQANAIAREAKRAEKAREPLRKAFTAAREMNEIMNRAVRTSYGTVNKFEAEYLCLPLLWPYLVWFPYDQWKSQLPRRFSAASKRVAKAARKLPNGPEKTLVLEFNRNAKALFALTHAAVVQKRIAEGKGSRWRLQRFQEKGLALIDNAAGEMGWQGTERTLLHQAFCRGELPDAEVFRKELGVQISRLSEMTRGSLP